MKIAIGIPFYQGEFYLKRLLDSIRSVTDQQVDVFLCDELNRSETRDLVFEKSNGKISYFANPQTLGIAQNWNRCLNLGAEHSDWVAIVHADDELEPHYADRMRELISKNLDAAAVFCDVNLIDGDGAPTWTLGDWVKTKTHPNYGSPVVLQGEDGIEALLQGNFIFCPALIYNRRILKDFYFNPKWGQVLDLEFVLRVLLAGHKIVGTPEKLYRYRRHGSNTTVKNIENFTRFSEEIDLYRQTAQACAAKGYSRAAKIASRMRITWLNFGFEFCKCLIGFRLQRCLKMLQFWIKAIQ